MVEEPVVGVELEPGPVLERVGEFPGVGGDGQRIVGEIELHPDPAGVLEDAEAPRDGPVAFGQVRAELEHALGGGAVYRGGEGRKAGRGAAGGAVHGADLAGGSA